EIFADKVGVMLARDISGQHPGSTFVVDVKSTGLVTAIAICQMLDRNPDSSMADLYRALPLTFGTPTMSPHCADDVKYGVVERVVSDFQAMMRDGAAFAGQKISDLITVNGVRVVAEDGTWGLV
ncbi:MAG: phosphomannomutase/phosphoglucomutase, partial [Mesorhizobium sp.]